MLPVFSVLTPSLRPHGQNAAFEPAHGTLEYTESHRANVKRDNPTLGHVGHPPRYLLLPVVESSQVRVLYLQANARYNTPRDLYQCEVRTLSVLQCIRSKSLFPSGA